MKILLKAALIAISLLIGIGKQGHAHINQSPPDTLHLAKPDQENNDSIEYELIILDARFDSWFVKTMRPPGFYTQSYLENWNRILTDQWNALIPTGGRRSCLPETYLNYDTRIDYGMELNHKLFYYFRYIQEVCQPFDMYPGVWN